MALLKSFVDVTPDSHFPIQNLPYGVFKPDSNSTPRPAVAIGDSVLDLSAISEAGLFDGPILNGSDCFLQPSLNKFLAMGRPAWKEARSTLQRLLSSTEPSLRDNDVLRRKSFYEMSKVEMVVPMVIGDYTDFFASMHHAKNCGLMFRGPQNAINPNWFRLPIAYHGRASSIVISGTDIIRPRGQGHPQGDSEPYFGPSKKLDFELEMAAVVGPGNELGKPIDVNNAADHIFGLVLMNDWSARDIQAWEYVPLGPFLGKSFGTTVSPWIVTLDALEPFSCQAPKQDPPPLPYLTEKESVNYDIFLEVQLKPSGKDESSVITKSNFQNLYWTITQQLAHHTVNGCNLRPGDLLGTGTISGPEPDSYGCLLELTWNGQKPLSMNGTTQTFLQLDTGSELTWVNCRFQGKGKENREVFRAEGSSSFKTVGCMTKTCKVDLMNLFSLSICPTPQSPCSYDYRYADGSTAQGVFATDTFTLGLTNGSPTSIPGLLIGCSSSTKGDSLRASDGVLGLAFSDQSFTAKATNIFGAKFSYCLVDHTSNKNISNYLTFGSNPTSTLKPPARRTARLELNLLPPFYAVSIVGISIGNTMLNIPPVVWEVRKGGGTILDSGSSLTFLADAAYKAVVSGLERHLVGLKRVKPEGLPMEYCFDTSKFDDSKLPQLSFHFKGGARFAPYRKSYLIATASPGIRCLGFVPAGAPAPNVIGNIMQQKHLWEFDLAASTLSFSPSTCL